LFSIEVVASTEEKVSILVSELNLESSFAEENKKGKAECKSLSLKDNKKGRHREFYLH